MRAAERGRLAELRRELVGRAVGRVLEVAAGTGLDFRHYQPNVTVVATPSLDMLGRGRLRAESAAATILLVAADVQALPFRARSFDTCVVALGLCTLGSPAAAVAELRRVVGSGGTLRILEHVPLDGAIVAALQDAFTPLWRRIAGGCRLNERSVDTVRRAGLRVDRIRRHLRGCVVGIEASRE